MTGDCSDLVTPSPAWINRTQLGEEQIRDAQVTSKPGSSQHIHSHSPTLVFLFD